MRRLLTNLVLVGGIVWTTCLAIARIGSGPRLWPIELLDTFALYASVSYLGGLTLLAALIQSRRLFGLLLVCGLLFWQQFGWILLPIPAPMAEKGVALRVLTYNKFFPNRDAVPLAELVQTVTPDVIVVEELTDGYAQDLKKSLGHEYEFSAEGDGSGVFSRLPILDTRLFRLWSGGYGLHQVRIEVGERPVVLFTVHLRSPNLSKRDLNDRLPPLVFGFDAAARDRELDLLIDTVSAISDPFILAGDFNIAYGSSPYRRFPAEWHDSFGERGLGLGHTWPTSRAIWDGRFIISFPLVRIDYVLSGHGLLPDHAWVPWLDGSDHLPVVADLHLSDPGRTSP